jgi:hypothetical protein
LARQFWDHFDRFLQNFLVALVFSQTKRNSPSGPVMAVCLTLNAEITDFLSLPKSPPLPLTYHRRKFRAPKVKKNIGGEKKNYSSLVCPTAAPVVIYSKKKFELPKTFARIIVCARGLRFIFPYVN